MEIRPLLVGKEKVRLPNRIQHGGVQIQGRVRKLTVSEPRVIPVLTQEDVNSVVLQMKWQWEHFSWTVMSSYWWWLALLNNCWLFSKAQKFCKSNSRKGLLSSYFRGRILRKNSLAFHEENPLTENNLQIINSKVSVLELPGMWNWYTSVFKYGLIFIWILNRIKKVCFQLGIHSEVVALFLPILNLSSKMASTVLVRL